MGLFLADHSSQAFEWERLKPEPPGSPPERLAMAEERHHTTR
jgi:hypothetical protein